MSSDEALQSPTVRDCVKTRRTSSVGLAARISTAETGNWRQHKDTSLRNCRKTVTSLHRPQYSAVRHMRSDPKSSHEVFGAKVNGLENPPTTHSRAVAVPACQNLKRARWPGHGETHDRARPWIWRRWLHHEDVLSHLSRLQPWLAAHHFMAADRYLTSQPGSPVHVRSSDPNVVTCFRKGAQRVMTSPISPPPTLPKLRRKGTCHVTCNSAKVR